MPTPAANATVPPRQALRQQQPADRIAGEARGDEGSHDAESEERDGECDAVVQVRPHRVTDDVKDRSDQRQGDRDAAERPREPSSGSSAHRAIVHRWARTGNECLGVRASSSHRPAVRGVPCPRGTGWRRSPRTHRDTGETIGRGGHSYRRPIAGLIPTELRPEVRRAGCSYAGTGAEADGNRTRLPALAGTPVLKFEQPSPDPS